jgi:hypothetical protein
MTVKKLSLVKYAGEYWFTLADYTLTRDTTGYSDSASVKSAVRTFVVKSNPDKYIAFRGEVQIKNIIQENKNNPFFQAEDFQGTRTALIHWDMLQQLNERFNINKEYKNSLPKFVKEAEEYLSQETKHREVAATAEVVPTNDTAIEARSMMLRQLRTELNRLDKNLEIMQRNREKVMQAISAIESLEIEEV